MPSPTAPAVSDVTATIGFFFILAAVIGTFFYLHLGNWLREILELKSKYDLNAVGEARREARLECRYQLQRLFNHVPFLTAAVISIFILVLVGLAMDMISAATPEPLSVPFYRTAAIYFLVTYFGLTAYLLIHGYAVASRLNTRLNRK